MSVVVPSVQGFYGKTNLDFENKLSGLVYHESIYGLATFKLKAGGYDWSVWDALARNEDDPALLRWGVVLEDGTYWAHWRAIRFTAGSLKYRLGTMGVNIGGVDYGWTLSQNASGVDVWKNMRISDIVYQLSMSNGFSSDVADTDGEYTIYRCGLSDLDLLTNVLLPRAIGVDGRTDYMFYIKNGDTMVFKPPSYKKVDYRFSVCPINNETTDGSFNSIDVIFRRVNLQKELSWDIKVEGYDPINKKFLAFRGNDKTVPHEKLAPNSPDSGKLSPSASIAVTNPGLLFYGKKDLENQGKLIWSRNHRGRFRAQIPSSGICDAYPGQVVSLDMRDGLGKDHFASDKWLIYAVQQRVIKNRYNTILYIERRETR